MGTMYFTDHDLSCRIELADAANSRACGNTLAQHHPDIGACTMDVAGGCAIYAGVGSPITQAIGLGMDVEVTTADMDCLEQFFESRGARVEVETSPLCHATLRDQFDARAYRTLEWSNVLFQRSTDTPVKPPAAGVEIKRATVDQADLWASLLCQGFAEDLGEAALALMLVGKTLFLAAAAGYIAYVDGQPAGGAALFIHEGVAGLMGAATLSKFRRRGVQSALLNARLDLAREQGCDMAYTITAPGSGSQRNVERAGFQVAYTRTKFYKPKS
jgi:GNAT superfamily N-acetyltransferase